MLIRPKSHLLRRCITGTSAIALATALATPAHAQLSYNAPDPVVRSGNVTFSRGVTPGVETYNVNSSTAVLDFTPNDAAIGGGPIGFQNAGTTATYQSNSNFTVLNRIVAADQSRPIQFDGTVKSQIVNPATGLGTPGGAVWFFSPGGVILGPNASFDVGSLLLSTGDPTGGTGTIGSTTSFTLNSAAGSNAAVTLNPGARITASPEGSYVALVAPVINQGGNVRVNGSAAYVAAEQATLSINQGLFDISVAVGSDGGGTPLTHNGSTGGPSSTGPGDNHGIYMVAVPKNTAITMLISPNDQLGFDTAASASIENGVIYLQSGSGISTPATTGPLAARIPQLPVAPFDSNIRIMAGNVTSRLIAQAASDVTLLPDVNTRSLTLAQDALLFGGRTASLESFGNDTINAAGNLTFFSVGPTTPGTVQMTIAGGDTVTVAGALEAYTDRFAGRTLPANYPSDGGLSNIVIGGGTLNAGSVRVSADESYLAGSPQASNKGGQAQIIVQSGGTLNVTSNLDISARGLSEGQATGGSAGIFVDGGTVKVGGAYSATADAVGAQVTAGSANFTHQSKGGSAFLSIGANGSDVQVTGAISLSTKATGSTVDPLVGGLGGAANGGNSSIIAGPVSAGTSSIKAGSVSLVSGATAGSAGATAQLATGGNAVGGTSAIALVTNSSLTVSGAMTVDSRAVGGNGGNGGGGGSATGGAVSTILQGGNISFGAGTLSLAVTGGRGSTGPAGTAAGAGGAALLGGGAGFNVTSSGVATGTSLTIFNEAFGGNGGLIGPGTAPGAGGVAATTFVGVFIDTGGQLTLTQNLSGDTESFGGDAGGGTNAASQSGGASQSGSLTINVQNGSLTASRLSLDTESFGGDGFTGGNAIGGNLNIQTGASGTITAANGYSLDTETFGGSGANIGGTGGQSLSGAISIDSSGVMTLGGITADTESFGGDGFTAGDAVSSNLTLSTAATGRIVISSGSISLDTLSFGGNANAGGSGGKATSALASIFNQGTFDSSATSVSIDSSAFGGDVNGGASGIGGAALPGTASIVQSGGTMIFRSAVQLTATGHGGNGSGAIGGGGGAANGGTAQVFANSGALTIGDLDMEARAVGGTAGSGDANSAGGNGGAALSGGGIDVSANGAGVLTIASLFADASATGGIGGSGFNNTGLAGSGGAAFSSRIGFGANNGGQLNSTGLVNLVNTARGGVTGIGIGQAGTTGGAATSGRIDVFANGGGKVQALTLLARTEADGGDGIATGSDGGDATGGTVNFGPDTNSTLTLTSTSGNAISIITTSFGGDNSGGGDKVAGFGKAGDVNMFANGSLQAGAGGSALIEARGVGGDYTALDAAGVAGAGFGGNAQLNVNRGDASFGAFSMDAGGFGGSAAGAGTGALGRGGHARLSTNGVFAGGGNGGNTLSFASTVSLNVDGFGGSSNTGLGGLGQGGASTLGGGIEIHSLGGTITFKQSVDLETRGSGGSGSGAGGGNGFGGTANVIAFGGKIDLQQSLLGSASGFGGDATEVGVTGVGGVGTGGTIGVFTQRGAAGVPAATPTSLSLNSVQFQADGFGGSGVAAGGGGVGGTAQVTAQGAPISVVDSIFVQANGTGGSYSGTGTANAGRGQGGLALVSAQTGGALSIADRVEARATGTGGSASAANGGSAGDGFGGTAQFASFGPAGSSRNTVNIVGNLLLDASGEGGSGGDKSTVGGRGAGGGAVDRNGNAIGTGTGALVIGNFGDVTLGNSVEIEVSGRGGAGSAAGGDGFGGLGLIDSVAGTITMAATSPTFIDAAGEGGDAFNASIGGRGGNGYGGSGGIHSRSGAATVNPSSTPSRITLGAVSISMTGQGGAAGTGAPGQVGGIGGDGFGGNSAVYAEAGRGHLVLGDLNVLMAGVGGAGGTGGAADVNGVGGAGGVGGIGTGGFAANTGTISGPDTPENSGNTIFGNVTLSAFGFGGVGGDGTAGGVGGAGGAGVGGQANLLVRGSPVTAGNVNAMASAAGGSGGAGSTQGAAGGSTGGVAGLLVTNRFQRTERGALTATNVSGSAFAFGDPTNKAVPNVAGAVDIEFVNSDATLDTLSFAASGRDKPTVIPASIVSLDNSNVTVRNGTELSIVGDLSLNAFNNAVFRTNSLFLDVTGSLVPPAAGAATPGLLDIATDFNANFGGDFVTLASFNVNGSVSIEAGGALQTGDITAGDAVSLQGGKSITVGKVAAAHDVSLQSGGAITAGDIAGGNGQPFGNIALTAGGNIAVGNMTAADSIVASAGGSLTAGKVTAALGDPSEVSGEVSLSAAGAISLGDIQAASVDIFVFDSLTLNLDKSFNVAAGSPAFYVIGDDFVLPADFTNAVLTISDLNFDDRGTVLLNGKLVDSAGIFAPGSGSFVFSPTGPNDPFNFPVANGPRNTVISTGFVPGANSLKLLVNDTNNGIFGNILPAVNISGGSIAATVTFSRGSVTPAPIQTGAISAERVTITGKADITTGNLKAADLYAGISTDDDFLVGIATNGNIRTGSISSLEYVGLESVMGSITTGAIDMGKSALLLAKTNVSTGAITGGMGANNDVFVSNSSIVDSNPAFADLKLDTIFSDLGNFDPAVLSTATPVRLDGRFVASGAITTGGFAGAATGGFQTGSITAPNRLLLDSGAGLSLGDLATNGALSLNASGALTTGNLTANTVNLKATQGVTTRAITAAGAVTVTAGTLASFGGVVSAPQITVSSADLQLDAAGAPGTLGTASTSQLTLNVTNTLPVTFGGSAAGAGYTITGTEAQGLRAQNVSLVTSDPITPIFMDSVNLSGADIGALRIKGGSITVNGAFTLANAAASNRVTLDSNDTISVVTDRGGALALTGSSSNPGTLTLIGNTIVVGTRTVLSQLGATNRADLLAAPSGPTPVPEGFVRAGRLEFQASSLLAIQNSGSATQYAGFSAGSGGMQVSNRQDTTPLAVLIFGRAADASGNFKTNNDTLALVNFGSATPGGTKNLTADSAVNTCLVSTGCGTVSPPPAGEGPLPPPQEIVIDRIPAAIADTVEGALSSAADPEKVAALPTVTLITTIDAGQLRTEPVISDPVSGGGNPSLWESPEDQDERQRDRPAPSKGGDQ
ncbi:beta strand repeat-containing protein [Sphingomonas tabacisoli]|uniref:Beta strand repeat-containing protein n=1 Tax=Sphingomonas tabacisoli TaxID=2249466 RepID=A0ABW4I2S3_9SPHN